MNSLSGLALALALALLPTLAWPLNSSAAPFTLRSFSVDGGGGRGAFGTYSLLSTVGQPDASPTIVAPPYAVTGGFLPGASGFSSPSAPRLRVETWAGGTLRLSWPGPAAGCVLEQTLGLAGNAGGGSFLWSQVEEPPQTSGSEIFVIVARSPGNRFFRLRAP